MKKEYIILTIIIIALGAYLYFQNSDSTHYTLPQPDALKQAEITKIEIAKKDAIVSISKEADNWFVGQNKFPADQTKLTPVLKMLEEIKLTALISESENYTRYELGDAGKSTVTAWANDKVVRKIDIGKTASSYKHTFVKLDGNKNVYHAAQNLKSIIDKTEDNFVDKTILAFKPESAYSVQISDGEKTHSFTKKMDEVKVDVKKKDPAEKPDPKPEEYWLSSTGEKKGKVNVEAFIKAFSNLECNSFVADLKKDTLGKPIYSVTVTTVNKPNTLSVYKSEKDKDLICTSSKSNFVFNLPADKLDKFKELFSKI